jgi:hypothetical protein
METPTMAMTRSTSDTFQDDHREIIQETFSVLRRVATRVIQWFDVAGGVGYCESEAERLLRSSGGRLTDAIERRLTDCPMARDGMYGSRYGM